VLDPSLTTLGVVDVYESFIWTDRYNAYGDFEIYTYPTSELFDLFQADNYLWIEKSDHMMIIEEREVDTDVEEGAKVYIRGRSLESILMRRIVWRQTVLTGNFQNAVLRLLNENAINPTDPDRKIPNLVFKASTDPEITSLTLNSAQFTGTELYVAIKALCEAMSIGFQISRNDNDEFEFSLVAGKDRSYAQSAFPYVIFSPEFDNILNSNYFETTALNKTVALIAGEGEGLDRRTATTGGGVGLARRELFVDARDISSETQDGVVPPDEYTAQLVQRGNEKIAEYVFVKSFEGEMETTQMFVLGKDFFMGDIVQIINEFGIEARTRIIEIIFSHNNNGISTVPTFQIVE
jgi:hypothetical protein